MRRLTPSRVLLTADAVGGVWRYVLELAGGLVSRGVQPVIAVLGPPPSATRRAEAAPVAEIVETGLPLDWTAESEPALAAASAALAALAQTQAVDLAHLHAPAFAGFGRWPVPVVSVAHSCVATWWRAVRDTALPPDLAWRAAATGRGLRRSDAVLAPTSAFADALRAAYGCDRPITVVHNGRRAPVMDDGPRERAVLAVGRLWDDGKNLRVLDRAAAELGAPVCAAGPTTGPHGGAAAFEHLLLLGELDDSALRHRYATLSVFTSPALYEPFGLGVLEAAQGGMALVLADIPTFRELWDGAATFVPATDDRALARALRRLLDDADAARRAGEVARERARRYTVAAMTDGTVAAHRVVLAQTAASA